MWLYVPALKSLVIGGRKRRWIHEIIEALFVREHFSFSHKIGISQSCVRPIIHLFTYNHYINFVVQSANSREPMSVEIATAPQRTLTVSVAKSTNYFGNDAWWLLELLLSLSFLAITVASLRLPSDRAAGTHHKSLFTWRRKRVLPRHPLPRDKFHCLFRNHLSLALHVRGTFHSPPTKDPIRPFPQCKKTKVRFYLWSDDVKRLKGESFIPGCEFPLICWKIQLASPCEICWPREERKKWGKGLTDRKLDRIALPWSSDFMTTL